MCVCVCVLWASLNIRVEREIMFCSCIRLIRSYILCNRVSLFFNKETLKEAGFELRTVSIVSPGILPIQPSLFEKKTNILVTIL